MKHKLFSQAVSVVFVVGTFFAAIGINVASATTYYVATTGDDSQSCAQAQSELTPRQTISIGMACLAAGDVLELKGGSYNEFVFNNGNNLFPDGTGPNNLTTIRGAAGESVIWTASGGQHIFLMKNAGSYTRFENIEFDGSTLGVPPILPNGKVAPGFFGSDPWKHFRQDGGITVGLEFVNNIVHDGPNNGMFNSSTTSSWLIEGNEFYDNGRAGSQFSNNMYLKGDNHVIRGNRVYTTLGAVGQSASGIRIAHNQNEDDGSNNNLVEKNFISVGGGGIAFGTGTNNIVRNNIVTSSSSQPPGNVGILLWAQGGIGLNDNNKIYNNTVYKMRNCIGTLNTEYFSITNSEANNNILYNCTSNTIQDPDGVIATANNLTTDPLFVDLTNDDYHVQTGSPAIDTGIILADVFEDYEGVPRPQGIASDIGAFESQNVGDPPPAVPTGLTASASGTTITLTWAANTESDLTGYKVFRGTSPGNYPSVTQVGTVVTYQATGLNPGTTYYFALKALDAGSNESDLSVEVNATTETSGGGSGGGVILIPQGQMNVTSVSSDTANKDKVLDGNSGTIWQASGAGPHEMILSLGGSHNVSEFRYLPYSWTKCTQYEVYVSATNGNWGTAVATGTWANDSTEKTASFSPTTGAFLRVRYLDNYCYAAEHNVGTSPTQPEADIPQAQMSVISVSSDTANKDKVLDGNSGTIWQASGTGTHEMILALGGSYNVSAFRYLPYSWTKCTQYEVYVSATNGNWGTAVATGTWANDSTEKTASFPSTTGSFLRVRYLNNYCYAAEHHVFGSAN